MPLLPPDSVKTVGQIAIIVLIIGGVIALVHLGLNAMGIILPSFVYYGLLICAVVVFVCFLIRWVTGAGNP